MNCDYFKTLRFHKKNIENNLVNKLSEKVLFLLMLSNNLCQKIKIKKTKTMFSHFDNVLHSIIFYELPEYEME